MTASDALLGRVCAGEDLSQEEMCAAIDAIMQGAWPPERIALLLTALRTKGETVEEIAGAAAAMRRHMTPIRSSHPRLIDTCGTGGDGSGTFNISTAAALVTAACGLPVAKHGNRSATGKTSSADVLAELGVNVEAPLPVVERCLEEAGICFCFAQQLHPAMRHVAAVRKSLGMPTIFNFLGPLCNPASAAVQLLGVGRPEMQGKVAEALARLGAERAAVVCGEDGLDEVTLSGPTRVLEVRGASLREFAWQAADFGLSEADRATLQAESPAHSAEIIRRVLAGEKGPPRDIVALNAGAALWVAGWSESPAECAAQAAEAIDSGEAAKTLGRFVEASRS